MNIALSMRMIVPDRAEPCFRSQDVRMETSQRPSVQDIPVLGGAICT